MNLEILQDKELVHDVLGTEPLTVRILRHFVEDSRGGSRQHLVEFMTTPAHPSTQPPSDDALSVVLMDGVFSRLRLFHVFDLIRITSTEFKRNQPPRSSTRQEFPSDDDFALVVAGILHRFCNDWHIEPSLTLSEMFPDSHPTRIEEMEMSALFFSRWCDQPAPERFSIVNFSSWNDGVPRTVRALPKVSKGFFLCQQSCVLMRLLAGQRPFVLLP